jgi:hypothetical protein
MKKIPNAPNFCLFMANLTKHNVDFSTEFPWKFSAKNRRFSQKPIL